MEQNKPILGMKSTMNDGYQLYLKKLFDRGMIHQPESLILTHTMDGNTHKMKYSEFRIYTSQLASALYNKYNIYIGDIISTFMWNNVRHMALYYTIPCIGSVLNPLNIRLHATELAYIISHSQPKIIFIDENLLLNFEKVLDINPLNTVKAFVICGNNQLKSTYIGKHSLLKNRIIDYDELITKYGSKIFNKWPLNLNEKSGCFLNYTSGTTGNPKGVINSHRSTSLRIILELVRYSANDCILGLPPMFHACGWGMPFIAMSTGAKIVLNNTCYDYNILIDLILYEKITRICGVPTMIEDFCNKLRENPSKYKNKLYVSEIRCGGAVCPPSIISYLYNVWNIELSHGWGMTECMPGCYSKRLQRRRDLKYSANKLIENQLKQGTFNPSMETLLVNTDASDSGNYNDIIDKNGKNIGELLIRGPCITNKYFKMNNNSKLHNKYFTKNGYLITGDIVTISKNEEMTIIDRSKDLIKSGGEWIASSDMENYIMKLGDGKNNIKCCAIIGQPHPRWNERPILVVERLNKNNLKLPKKINIINHLKLKYAKFQLIDDILFWDNIPLTGTGKKSKKIIREKLKKENYILPQLRKKK
eukprot:507348_1